MATVIRLETLAIGIATEYDGQYVVSFDPAKNDGQGELIVTPDEKNAQRFPSVQDAIEYYRQAHGVRSTDGLPNRPLTAFSASFERAND